MLYGKELNNICVISPGYPSEEKPYTYTFVEQLVNAIADRGINVFVITPHDSLKTGVKRDLSWTRYSAKGNKVTVYSPAAPILTTRKIGILNFNTVSTFFYKNAVNRVLKRIGVLPDLVYAHFLSPAGVTAAYIGKKYNIPSMCAFGESSLWSIRELGLKHARKKLSELSGVVAVSTHNKNVLIENELIESEKIRVFPNAVNHDSFYPHNKAESRKILKIPENEVVGIYTGTFSYSKGSLRVQEAAEKINGLKMVYIGNGQDKPNGENILYKGRVAHEDIPVWLSAADFFVLPTLEEGCCNAVIEAMACGLPVITSNLPFNFDILDKKSALLIDPKNVDQICDAMKRLYFDSDLRKQFGEKALEKSKLLDINIRAERIVEFMESLV